MLRLFRAGYSSLEGEVVISAYRDSRLLDIGFVVDSSIGVRRRKLTKFRMSRSSGDLLSLELRGAVLIGIEMLVSQKFSFDQIVEVFSNELPERAELPLLGVELDGKGEAVEVTAHTIDQDVEFSVRFASISRELEIAFDIFTTASRFGRVSIFYNDDLQLAGIRVPIPTEIELFK